MESKDKSREYSLKYYHKNKEEINKKRRKKGKSEDQKAKYKEYRNRYLEKRTRAKIYYSHIEEIVKMDKLLETKYLKEVVWETHTKEYVLKTEYGAALEELGQIAANGDVESIFLDTGYLLSYLELKFIQTE